jgi:MFS family permease
VLVTNLATFLVGGGNFAVMVLVPQVVQAHGAGLGLDATRAGLLLLPGALMMIPVGAAAGRMTARFGNRLVVVLGGAISSAGFVLLSLQHRDQIPLMLGSAAVFSGVALVMAALTNLIVDVAPHPQIGEATGVNGLFRLSGSAAGAAVAVAILTTEAPSLGGVAPGAVTAAFVTFAGVMALSTSFALVLPRSPGPRDTIR